VDVIVVGEYVPGTVDADDVFEKPDGRFCAIV
jgi:hypothetical protein